MIVQLSKICSSCPKILTGRQTRYCSRKCHNADSNVRLQNYELQQARDLSRKGEIIQLKGGKSELCGY